MDGWMPIFSCHVRIHLANDSLMIIDNLDVFRSTLFPGKADSPLIVLRYAEVHVTPA